MNKHEFYFAVADALSGCQLVEQVLKLYITEALQLAKKCIGDNMIFKIDGKEYEDAPLGRLIGIFKKLNNNENLIIELGKFKEDRNFLSHRGISHVLDYDGDLSTDSASEYKVKLAAIKDSATRLSKDIYEEHQKISVHLWFENLDLRNRTNAVLYAQDTNRVATFYANAIGFSITHAEASHIILYSPTFQLIVNAIPAEIAAEIEIATPPVRREDTPIKLSFPVASISASRTAAAKYGGELNAKDREWEFRGRRICDGHDPEGNVIQVSVGL
jgi:predicted enzyme related to lactoylglutathione lyase